MRIRQTIFFSGKLEDDLKLQCALCEYTEDKYVNGKHQITDTFQGFRKKSLM